MMLIATYALGLVDLGDGGKWIFLSVGAVCLFAVFLPIVIFLENRRKEREAYYKADMMRRMAEAPAESSRAALELMREEDRLRRLKQGEGLKIGGVVNLGIGIGLSLLLYTLTGKGGPYMVGAIPGFIGIALLVYAFFMAEPIH
jgi:hypothetical protein